MDELKEKNWFKLPTVGKEFAAKPFVDFRESPEQNKLQTVSGKIEIFSEKIESFGYKECPGHPIWV